MSHPQALLRYRDLQSLIKKSRTSIFNLLNPKSRYYDPTFPKPFKVGSRSIAFLQTEVDDWVKAQVEKSRQPAAGQPAAKAA